jgi:hypothetical protein
MVKTNVNWDGGSNLVREKSTCRGFSETSNNSELAGAASLECTAQNLTKTLLVSYWLACEHKKIRLLFMCEIVNGR